MFVWQCWRHTVQTWLMVLGSLHLSPNPQTSQTSRFPSSTRPPLRRTCVLIADPYLAFRSDWGWGTPTGHLVTSISGSSALAAQGKELDTLHLHVKLGGNNFRFKAPDPCVSSPPRTGTEEQLGLACRISAPLTFLRLETCTPPSLTGACCKACSLPTRQEPSK